MWAAMGYASIPASPEPESMKNTAIVRRYCLLFCSNAPIILLVGCLLVAGGCDLGGPPAGPAGTPPPPKVTAAKPLVMSILEWDAYTGRLAPIEEVDVQARVTGYLRSHHFEEGELVEAGQLLFVIDTRPYEAAVSEAAAATAEAQANYRRSQAGLEEARAKMQQATARFELAQARLRRAQPLVPSGAISQDEYDVLASELRQADADRYAAQAEIASAEAAIKASEASIATATAAEEAAQLDLGYCRIEAPISGRIGSRQVTEGNLISAGSFGLEPLTTIVSLNPVHANFDADERALMKYIRLDQASQRTSARKTKVPAYMSLIDEEGYPHQGYIDFVDNRVDQATGSIRARAIFPNDDEVLTPGAFVRIRVPGNEPRQAVLIPDAAVATDQASKFVYLVGEGSKIEARPIKTGRLNKGLRIVESGLDGSETIVIRGLQRCRPGAAVDPSIEVIEPGFDEGLPDTYEPVPPEQWLTTESGPQSGAPAEAPGR